MASYPVAPFNPVTFNTEYGTQQEYTKAIEELRSALPVECVSTDREVLELHGRPVGFFESIYLNLHRPRTTRRYTCELTLCLGSPHTVVVFPSSTEDVVKIVNISWKYRMPIVPYSGATSLEGHYIGVSET